MAEWMVDFFMSIAAKPDLSPHAVPVLPKGLDEPSKFWTKGKHRNILSCRCYCISEKNILGKMATV